MQNTSRELPQVLVTRRKLEGLLPKAIMVTKVTTVATEMPVTVPSYMVINTTSLHVKFSSCSPIGQNFNVLRILLETAHVQFYKNPSCGRTDGWTYA